VIALSLLSALLLAAAMAAMLARNLIHSALLLVGAWAGIAGFYLWANAEFIAFAQVLVYVGAVSMVVLFAVLLTRQNATAAPVEFESLLRATIAFVVAGGVAGLLIGAVLAAPFDLPAQPATATLSVKEIGGLLMGPQHVGALLVVGVILTVALLGGVVIAATDKPEDRP
jgi:NADH:ubiquinone oxidoreductase subunit 6 (subunit J)